MVGLVLKYPKIAISIVAVLIIGSIGVHYKVVLAERAELRADNATLRANAETLGAALAIEREAAETALQERDEAQKALEKLREGRENDPEAQAWGAVEVPAGEQLRLCEALPGMDGCQNTPTSN